METQEAQGNGARTKGTSQIGEKNTSKNLQDKVIEYSTPESQVERITGQVMEVSKTRKIQNFEKIENQEAEVNGARTKETAQI